MKASRITLASLGCVAVFGALLMIGSGKESRAQVGTPKEATKELALPAETADPGLPKLADPPQPPGAPSDLGPASTIPGVIAAPPEPKPTSPVPSTEKLPPATAVEADPEKAAKEFVEKNQKVAEAELATLLKEAEALRNRLQKVESAIRRWESVSHALKQSQGIVSKLDGTWKPNDPFPRRAQIEDGLPVSDSPTVLEPIEPPGSFEKRATVAPSNDAVVIPSPEMIGIPANPPRSTPVLKVAEPPKPKS